MNAPSSASSAPASAPSAGMASITHTTRVTDAEVSVARSMVNVAAMGGLACDALSASLDAIDTARADFDRNHSNGVAAESEAAEAETSWVNGGQTDELWSHVETAQRRARQCFLRARPLLSALERAEASFLSELRAAARAERDALAEEFKATIAPMLADYAAHAIEMQAAGHRIDAARNNLRVRAMGIFTRALHAGTAPRGGPPPELSITLDGFTLANNAVRRAAAMLARRGVSVGEFTPMHMLQRCDSEHEGAERMAVDAAAEMLAPVLDSFIGDDSAHGTMAPPRPPVRVRNKHTAPIEKIKPGEVGFVDDNAALAAMIKGGLLEIVDVHGVVPPDAATVTADASDAPTVTDEERAILAAQERLQLYPDNHNPNLH